MWYRSGNPEHRRLTRFFGTLLVINVAIGVVTGLVQEFEFGMNWSAYSRFVGDVFGAPLAMEGLAAFFLESTFLGLWLFGWDRLPKRIHLACIWLVAFGAGAVGGVHHGGQLVDAAPGRLHDQLRRPSVPELNNIGAVFTNPVFVWGYVHVLLASLVTGALVMLAVSAWHLRRGRRRRGVRPHGQDVAGRAGPGAILLNLIVGSHLGVIETTYQPMKIAAAEAQWNDLPAVLVLGVPDRRRARTTRPRPRSSRSPICCRCSRPAPGTARS